MTEATPQTHLMLTNLRALPAKKRLDAIIDHPRPLELVRALDPHDVALLLREIGAEDALELVELLSPLQVQQLLDFEIWQSDQIDPKKAGHYFSLLFAANDERAITQIHGLDIELVGVMFKMVALIYDRSIGEEPEDYSEIYSISPGERFVVCFDCSPEHRALSQSLHAFLESMYGRNMKVALGLLEDIRFELASGLEELSLRFRQHRLLDLGILPREERLEFFAPIALSAIAKNTQANSTLQPLECRLATRPYVDDIDPRYPFLRQAISECEHAEQAAFLDYLAHASINLHASLVDDFSDAKLLKITAEYTKALVELGLAQACDGNIYKASLILKANSIKKLVRLGRTSLVTMRKILVSLTKDENYSIGKDFSFLDSPLREVAKALSLSEPRFYAGLIDAKKLDVRFFSSLIEVNATLMAINEIKFRALFMGAKGLGLSEKDFLCHPESSHGSVYARYLVNKYLGKEPTTKLSFDEVESIFSAPQRLHDDFVALSKKLSSAIAQRLADNDCYELEKARTLAHNFSTTVLVQLEQNHRLLLS